MVKQLSSIFISKFLFFILIWLNPVKDSTLNQQINNNIPRNSCQHIFPIKLKKFYTLKNQNLNSAKVEKFYFQNLPAKIKIKFANSKAGEILSGQLSHNLSFTNIRNIIQYNNKIQYYPRWLKFAIKFSKYKLKTNYSL